MPAWENAPIVKKKNAWEDAPVIDEPRKQTDPSSGDLIMNAIRGFAGRGNQAMGALNPWANQEKLAAEKQWMATHPGAEIGSTVADIAMTLPAGGAGSMAARALGTAAIEGATRPGGIKDRLTDAALGAVGSGAGEGVAKGASFLLRPFGEATDAATKKLVKKAQELGIDLNAAQVTGNKSLQYADSALDSIPSSSTAQQEFKAAQRKAWQKALFKQGNEAANTASPEAMGAMKNRISAAYEDIAGRNALTVDADLKQALAKVRSDYAGIIPTNQKSIVKKYLSDFDQPPIGADISGKTYQQTRSMLDKQANAFKNSDPATYGALKDIRSAIDDAMTRSLGNPSRIGGKSGDAEKWKQANKDWLVMKNIEKGIDPVTGDISPNKLMSGLTRKDANRVIYGQGDQELTDIAKVGKKFIPASVPDSGTAQRQMMIRLLEGGGLGAAGATAYYDPKLAAGLAGTGLLAILAPKAAGAMMRSPNGYLSKGLVDLNKEVIPGLTREGLLTELMRNSGVQSFGRNN